MSKIKQNLPVILALLEGGRKLIQSIADAIVESGGLGFRKRMKQFAEETNEALKSQSEAIHKAVEAQEEDAQAFEKELNDIKKELAELRSKLPA